MQDLQISNEREIELRNKFLNSNFKNCEYPDIMKVLHINYVNIRILVSASNNLI